MSLPERARKIHFVGIGGIGMSGLAELLLGLGHRVSGSDLSESEVVLRLKSLGAEVQVGHHERVVALHHPDVVVYSTAVRADNPELLYARTHEIPVIRRAEMLAEIMRLKRGIAIAGSHGKTTTTGLTALLLRAAGLDPTVVIGGKFDAIGSNAALGQGQWTVAEADESDGSFLRLSPEYAVVTNIDREHLDHYKSFENEKQAFSDFLDRIPFYGRAILCSDSAPLREFRPAMDKPRYWYGFHREFHPDFHVRPQKEGAQPEFEVWDLRGGRESLWARLQLSVPGRHNMLNATAAALVAAELGIPAKKIEDSLREFRGVRRRFDRRGVWKEHLVIEDYAHHPTEIRATLEACRSAFPDQQPWVLFQPHRYTRTRDLWEEFAGCFQGAECVFCLPIYAASEPQEEWTIRFDGERFARHLQGVESRFCSDREEMLRLLTEWESKGISPKAPILVLGAGDISKVIPRLLKTEA